MALNRETLTYQADGLSMQSELIWDDAHANPRPGVLVFPEAFGLGAHAIGRAERLARDFGYVALACDILGGAKIVAMEQLADELGPLRSDSARTRGRCVPAFNVLSARPEVDSARIAAMGFCFGGTTAFELALAGVDLRAAIGFHSGLAVTRPEDAAQIRGKVLALLGADDPGIPPEQRSAFEEAMRAGGVDWQMHLYGGVVHSFTNPEAESRNQPDFLRYDAVADARSWQSMAALLTEVFA